MSSSLLLDLARYRRGGVPEIGLSGDLAGDRWDGWFTRDDWSPAVLPGLARELARVPDPRRTAGRRFDLVFLLMIVVMAVMAGAVSVSGVMRWAGNADPRVLAALARGGRCTLPALSTLSRLLARLDGDALDDAFARYTAAVLAPGDPEPVELRPEDCEPVRDECGPGKGEPAVPAGEASAPAIRPPRPDAAPPAVSLDGKCVRGAATATSNPPHLVSVFRHDTKTIAAHRQVDVKSNEITVFQTVLDVLPDLAGKDVVADALHTQREHAHYLHHRDAFSLFPVAENQPKLFAAVDALP